MVLTTIWKREVQDEEHRKPIQFLKMWLRNWFSNSLKTVRDKDLLTRLFCFFEGMANSRDPDVKDLLRIAILETLVYRRESLRRAWKYMGTKTKEFAVWEAEHQGRQAKRLPQS